MELKSTFVPDDWQPEPILPIYRSKIDPGVDVEKELLLFKLHEFAQPKGSWQRAWIQWLMRATPPRKTYSDQAADVRKQTVPSSESRHPALVAERQGKPVRFGQ